VKKTIYLVVALAIIEGGTLGALRLPASTEAAMPPAQAQAVAAPAEAADSGLTAEVTGKGLNGEAISYRLSIKGKKARIDIGDQSTIMRLDLNLIWRINHPGKWYTAENLAGDFSGVSHCFDLESSYPLYGDGGGYNKALLGQERANGYLCNKYFFTPLGKGASLLVWYAKDPGLTVRVEIKRGEKMTHLDLNHISAAKLADSLFEVPEGYQLKSTPKTGDKTKGEATLGTGAEAVPSPGASQFTVAPWDRIQQEVADCISGGTYRLGEEIAARPGGPPEANTADSGPYQVYLLASFAQDLTPEQYQTMSRSGRLPYAELTSRQQQMAAAVAAMFPNHQYQLEHRECSVNLILPPGNSEAPNPRGVVFILSTVNEEGIGLAMAANF
jgi:hypothetical protein